MLGNYVEAFLNLLYPSHCLGCQGSLHREEGRYICKGCRQGIHYITEPRCPRCGVGIGAYAQVSREGCIECRHIPGPRFDRAFSATYYEGVIRELIHQFKYSKHEFLVTPLAETLLESLGKGNTLPRKIDKIVAVPLHWKKRVERGFNQAESLALRVGRHLGVEVSRGGLQRVRDTLSQSSLPYSLRKKNVRDAFKVKIPGEFRGKDILLVDDVLTTGLTASECARTLKAAGARSVYVLTLAKSRWSGSPSP